MTAHDHWTPLVDLEGKEAFVSRHIGPPESERAHMLAALGLTSMEELIDATVPEDIRMSEPLDLPSGIGQTAAQNLLRSIARSNQIRTSLIGMGYHETITPPVIRRNILENPGWYTAYTPYQPEISQGRLEALLNFQTMAAELTGMDLANASLLDEATAVAEAMTMLHRVNRKKTGDCFLIDAECHPQTISVVETRAEPIGLSTVVGDPAGADLSGVFAVVVQYPGTTGVIPDLEAIIERAHAADALVAVAADPLALVVLAPPGEFGADAVVGSTQRFGIQMGFGGPHAAYFAVREQHQRSLPGRLVGVSRDAGDRRALRLALQTREQHIRRERATSNICTSQVLLAVMASMFAIHHGPVGLRRIAMRVNRFAAVLADGLRRGGLDVLHEEFFDTVCVRVPGRADKVLAIALSQGVNLRRVDADTVSITLHETTTRAVIEVVWSAFGVDGDVGYLDVHVRDPRPVKYRRDTPALQHPIFTAYHSETDLVRYMRQLVNRDIALDRSMIPLGSCTMKLNAATEMEPVSWPEFARIHPFAPVGQTVGYQRMIDELERWLTEITGYAAVSLQPNSGAQGELAGLLAIRAYHRSRGEAQRDVCLIPSSAHGTNAASAVMAGMRVLVVDCDGEGNVEIAHLDKLVSEHRRELAALMITYPSTHGVFEVEVRRICEMVHDAGGQVYLDGANLNAMVGLAQPGKFGADVSHLNLHKTFCIPHGGGGPGIGPIGVGEHLVPFLPNHPLTPVAGPPTSPGPVAAAPWGSAGILAIPWMYIRMMGAKGLRQATETAILNANYIAKRLEDYYPVLYRGANGWVAHECILDTRIICAEAGLKVDDIAKRLIDFGFHAPTMSFPVPETLMVEPTESESLAELDRFCDAMIAVHGEAKRVASGDWPEDDNPLVNAPHTASDVTADSWPHPYSRSEAAFPDGWGRADKYWPPVSRIDGVYGDRNLMCSCPPMDLLSE
ncbi:MAG: aminomethyl-transferring glycine dehydrogenase [Acidimicrobiaceae bacterium]|nr:aminomethyl-transferring glycine dehydrogenase [Acidimicrobiaceae bacterium]